MKKENSTFGFENCGKFLGNFGKCNALGPFIPLEDFVYKFSAWLLKNSSKMRLPHKNYFTQKVCLHQKSVSPEKRVTLEKMFHLKNLTNPKKFLMAFNIYVKIPNFLTSENFGKFLRWKSICSFFSFPVS